MFPAAITGPVTIWPRYIYSDGSETNIRCVLQGCFWNADSIAVYQRTGEQTKNSVTLFIPYAEEVTGLKYLAPEDWNALNAEETESGMFWTIDPKQLPLMINGVSGKEFERSAPTAENRLTVQENDFLNTNSAVRRAQDVNNNFYGSPEMWHALIRV